MVANRTSFNRSARLIVSQKELVSSSEMKLWLGARKDSPARIRAQVGESVMLRWWAVGGSAYQRLVRQRAEVRRDRVGVAGHKLEHQNTDQLFAWVDPEVGVGHAAPAICSDRAQILGMSRVEQHAHAEP